jgi:cellulose synthase/poly-beta-1,6-N-acetylglucosamine synthase-like glycosyltransferase
MTVSIIIAVKTWQKNLEECIAKCEALDFSNFEILILPDGSFIKEGLSTQGAVPKHIIPTGPLSAAKKRDLALKYAKGEVLAFIDDDAYPDKDWLKNAIKYFKDENIAAVGGPAITPSNDTVRQRASGAIYASFLVSGDYNYRYVPKNKREVNDYPSCNFLVRKSVMEQLGGFNTNFWPGEDTKLCLDITKKIGKKIIYEPSVLVYHHRRPIFISHLRQVASYALHRGYFVKRYPQTSLRFTYFIPSIFVTLILVGGSLSFFLPGLRLPYLLCLTVYFLIIFIFIISKELQLIPLVFFGIILTHLTYGIYFLKGLLSQRLKEEMV